ncbi:MAG: hypothetical protein QNK20_13300 [Aureibaculum sp.]|nr:hypothetical protein [Aureibaculum sp.]
MENINEKLKGADNEKIKAPLVNAKEEEKSISEIFMEELDEHEKSIFLELKSILMDKCEYLEFEAVNNENLDDYVTLITYIKNGVATILSDGVSFNLRRPILDSKGDVLTKNVTVLFERNENRERGLTKNIKVSKKSLESQKDFTRAVFAASLKSVELSEGRTKMISVEDARRLHTKDYSILLTIYNFFRN